VISEETSEQLDIVPMQIRVIKHIRKVYGCRGCETAPVTADKPAQLIEKSMAKNGAESTWHRDTAPNLGTLGNPVQRTLPAAVEFDA
ncbi:ISPsy5, transposase, partial [Pseudomonas syringae pv. actinidiae ICMP 19096]